VVLGHTQCGAVTAVSHAVLGHGHPLERNIPPLVDNIQPAVERALALHPDVHGDAIIPHGIEENVWQGIEDLFTESPVTRDLVKAGKAKVVGAVYDVGTGVVDWLPEPKSTEILHKVEANPNRALNAMADSGDDTGHAVAESHAPDHAVQLAAATSHGASDPSGGHGAETSAEDQAAVSAIVAGLSDHASEHKAHEKEFVTTGQGNMLMFAFLALVVLVCIGLTLFYAAGKDQNGDLKFHWTLGPKIISGVGFVTIVLAGIGVYSVISIRSIGEGIEEIVEDIIPVTNAVSTIETHQLQQAVAMERAFRFGEEEGAHAEEMFEKEKGVFEELAKKVDSEIEEIIAMLEETPAFD
jgi:carbonic anhydrase-like protein